LQKINRVLQVLGVARKQLAKHFAFSHAARGDADLELGHATAVVAGLETSIFSGLCRKVSVMRRISGGIVR